MLLKRYPPITEYLTSMSIDPVMYNCAPNLTSIQGQHEDQVLNQGEIEENREAFTKGDFPTKLIEKSWCDKGLVEAAAKGL